MGEFSRCVLRLAIEKVRAVLSCQYFQEYTRLDKVHLYMKPIVRILRKKVMEISLKAHLHILAIVLVNTALQARQMHHGSVVGNAKHLIAPW